MHTPDGEKLKMQRTMGLGLLVQSLFVSGNTLPDVLQQAQSLGVSERVVDVLIHVHLKVRWGAHVADSPLVGIRVDPEDDSRLRIRVALERPFEHEQLLQVCTHARFLNVKFEPHQEGQEDHGNFFFTMPQHVVRLLRGEG